jgi:hypothetical protein
MSQVEDLLLEELALLGLQLKAMALEAFENLFQVSQVGLKVRGVNDDVVQVYQKVVVYLVP